MGMWGNLAAALVPVPLDRSMDNTVHRGKGDLIGCSSMRNLGALLATPAGVSAE